MADRKISELPAATLPLAGTEDIPLVQGGQTRQANLSDVRDAALRAEVEAARGDRSSLNNRISTISNFASANPVRPLVGRYYDQALTGSNSGTRAAVTRELLLSPFYTSQRLRIDEIGVSISTQVAGSQGRCCIYSSDDQGVPDALLFAGAGDLDFSTTGFKSHVIDFTFDAGRQYWLGLLTNGTATFRTVPVASMLNLGMPAGSNAIQYGTVIRRLVSNYSDPLPDPFVFVDADINSSGANVPAPSIRMRAAAL